MRAVHFIFTPPGSVDRRAPCLQSATRNGAGLVSNAIKNDPLRVFDSSHVASVR